MKFVADSSAESGANLAKDFFLPGDEPATASRDEASAFGSLTFSYCIQAIEIMRPKA